MTRQKLPIGLQTFRTLREEGCYYVDKTPFALKLIEEGSYYFLSRPRRFGKSLFLDTLAELFAGSEALFQELYIHERWDWSRRYPVIRLSFGGGVVRDQSELEAKIREQLDINQEALGIPCQQPTVPGGFAELIRKAHAATGERVVV
ncbi:MAG: AAA family ATPase, partial [Methylococcus sp.]